MSEVKRILTYSKDVRVEGKKGSIIGIKKIENCEENESENL